MQRIFKKKIVWLIIISTVLFIAAYVSLFFSRYNNPNVIFGASFDPVYANYLGLDPEKVFEAISHEWGFKHVRLMAHWDLVQVSRDKFDFSNVDKYIASAEQNKIKIMLAVGQKTPRWPECHIPAWAATLSKSDYQPALNNYITEVINRYKNSPALEIWQVENEPFLPFGECPPFSRQELAAEIDMVKKLDPVHRVIVTDSGELSTWLRTARAADLFGTTMYRIVWSPRLGYVSYNWIPAALYRYKLALLGRSLESSYVVELQAEPWLPGKNINDVPLDEQYKSLSLALLQDNVVYARKAGLSRAYLWGAEWWYWLKNKGLNEISDYIKTLPK